MFLLCSNGSHFKTCNRIALDSNYRLFRANIHLFVSRSNVCFLRYIYLYYIVGCLILQVAGRIKNQGRANNIEIHVCNKRNVTCRLQMMKKKHGMQCSSCYSNFDIMCTKRTLCKRRCDQISEFLIGKNL